MFKKVLGLSFATLLTANVAVAQQGPLYEVSITNLTPGQSFTPQMVVSHRGEASMFVLGEPASPELEELAEGGATGPLSALYDDIAIDSTVAEGPDVPLLLPGQTTSVVIRARARSDFLSVAAMLLPTNDTFIALDSVRLPRRGSASYLVPAYDAGTEENDQDCANIPGPMCGGLGGSAPAAGDEGYVHISNGFHDLGETALAPEAYDWRNPVALITVTRMRN